MQTRKTKIICTVGPASASEETLRQLIHAGMNVARLNFSHGSYEEHKSRINLIKKLRTETNQPVALLLDTKGPEIRLGAFDGGKAALNTGDTIIIRHDDILGTASEFSLSYKDLHKDIHVGSRILLDDGLIELIVKKIQKGDIHCHVENGGPISDKKSVNIPGGGLRLPSLTEKDREDILFAIAEDMDFIAASFVRRARDVQTIRSILEQNGGSGIQIIAKIENGEGVANFEEILKVSDGIMIARGDLGVEIPAEDVPFLQKKFIRQCQNACKISITATQMLDSMIRNPRPTRAEVSDVANAIYDGTCAVMLSGETAAGKYPIESLTFMTNIVRTTENSIDYRTQMQKSDFNLIPTVENAISHATCYTAMDLDATAIVCLTYAGRTARLVSRFRPGCPIIASTTSPKLQRQLNLQWAVIPICIDVKENTDEVLNSSIDLAKKLGFLTDGDTVVATGGSPLGVSGTTNMIRVRSIGESFVQGKGQLSADLEKNRITGTVMIIRDPEQPIETKKISASPLIVVSPYTNNQMMPLLRQADALIVEDDDPTSHASTTGMALDIPVILSCSNATNTLKDGWTVTVDAARGTVS